MVIGHHLSSSGSLLPGVELGEMSLGWKALGAMPAAAAAAACWCGGRMRKP